MKKTIGDNNGWAGRITGCIPLSFGVMMRVRFVQETVLESGMRIEVVLPDWDTRIQTTVINVEKDYTIYTSPTQFHSGETGNVVLEYNEGLSYFPLRNAGISPVSGDGGRPDIQRVSEKKQDAYDSDKQGCQQDDSPGGT